MAFERKEPLFTSPLETFSGLTISDLNRYLPAIQKIEDLKMTNEDLREGLFLGLGLDGLRQLPEDTIDLIIADPPESPWRRTGDRGSSMTIQEYYQWNQCWLEQSYRVLRNTGAIYLMTGWRYSGMYQALLSNYFKVQSRITWPNRHAHDQPSRRVWLNHLSDIWFATKTKDFMFNQQAAYRRSKIADESYNLGTSNFWGDILNVQSGNMVKLEGDKPEQLIQRILNTSSFKLNWIVDPFMRAGGVGVVAKKMGRRFIGFESDQDRLLVAMKRIDRV